MADYDSSPWDKPSTPSKDAVPDNATSTAPAGLTTANLYGPGTGGLDLYGTPEQINGAKQGLQFGQLLYGQGIGDVGKEASAYSNMLYGRLNQDSSKADVYRQDANRRIAKGANRLGMAGANMGGAEEQAYRQSGMNADAMNQEYKDKALAAVGANISAKQRGLASQYMAGQGVGQANTPSPVANYDDGLCCFIFLEARYGNGKMDSVVRRYRDENMTERNRRGYYKLSEILVPLMRKYKTVKFLTRMLMTDPMVAYGKAYYGENKIGFIFKPIVNFWLNTYDYLGGEHKFIRENGEVC
jgi:hypothetical protein